MKRKHVSLLHIPGQGLRVLLIRIFIEMEIRSFWVRPLNFVDTPRSYLFLLSLNRLYARFLLSFDSVFDPVHPVPDPVDTMLEA